MRAIEISEPRKITMLAVLLTISAGALTGGLFAAEVTDALVKDVIAQGRTDIQRATMLYDAVPVAKDNAKLQIALLEKAVQYGISSRSGKGIEIAARSLALLGEKAPGRNGEWKAKTTEMHRSSYRLSRTKAEKAELGQKLAASLAELAGLYETQGKWREAATAYYEADTVAASKTLQTEMQQKRYRANYFVMIQRNVPGYKRSLETKPQNASVRMVLLKNLVIDLDNPKEGSKYLTEDVDEMWRTFVPLAARAADTLKTPECKSLGDWYYKKLFKTAVSFSKANVLVRAKRYYELFIEGYKGADAHQLFQAKTALGQVAKELEKLGAKVVPKDGKTLTLDLGKGVTMKFVRIPAGKFVMGSPNTEKGREDCEGPQRQVTISKAFYMGVTEVTQSQYESVTGKNPSRFKGTLNPVDSVSWNDATAFCAALSKKTRRVVHLPTEAQWEYACRAGTTTRFSFGGDDKNLDAHGWCKANSGGKTHPVGQKKPNAFGLYDMHGNVFEWCRDCYDEKFYANAKNVDPKNTTAGSARVLRSGSWRYGPGACRAAGRHGSATDGRHISDGFRVVVDADRK